MNSIVKMHSREPKMPKNFRGLRPRTPAAARSARSRAPHSRSTIIAQWHFAPLSCNARCTRRLIPSNQKSWLWPCAWGCKLRKTPLEKYPKSGWKGHFSKKSPVVGYFELFICKSASYGNPVTIETCKKCSQRLIIRIFLIFKTIQLNAIINCLHS